MKKILNKKGFTLIELIVVIAILAILAAILIPSLLNYLTAAEEARDTSNARSYYSELVLEATTGTLRTAGTLGDPDLDCSFAGTTAQTIIVTCGTSVAP